MLAQGPSAPRPGSTPGTQAMVGNRVPLPHRFYLVDGRTISGHLHKAPTTRLADHLATIKGGFISVTNATCDTSGKQFPYIAINQSHVIFIEEVTPARPVRPGTPGAAGNVPR